MLPRADLTSIRPVAAIDAPRAVVTVADARQDALARLTQIALGQQVRATVLSMNGQANAIGQVVGGPPLGALANRTSVSTALTASALILSPIALVYARLRPGVAVPRAEGELDRRT